MAITGASGAPYAVRLLEALVARAPAGAAHRVGSRIAAAADGDGRRHDRGAAGTRGRRGVGCVRHAVRRRRSRRGAGVWLGAQSRHGDLSLLDGDDQRDQSGDVALARRAGGGRGAQGAPHAGPRAARDAVQRDPSREHAASDARRRDRAAGEPGILSSADAHRRAGGLRGGARARSSRRGALARRGAGATHRRTRERRGSARHRADLRYARTRCAPTCIRHSPASS